MNVQQRGAVDNPAAELVRRAVRMVFVAVNDFVDADIGGFRGHDRNATGCGRRDHVIDHTAAPEYASAMRAFTNAKSRSAAARVFCSSAAGVAPAISYSRCSDVGP